MSQCLNPDIKCGKGKWICADVFLRLNGEKRNT